MALGRNVPEILRGYEPIRFNLGQVETNFINRNGFEPKRNFKLNVKDESEALAMKASFEETSEEQEKHKLSGALEVFVDKFVAQSKWFGPNAEIFAASAFDDSKNGIDFVLKLKDGDTEAIIGIDLVIGDRMRIDSKLQREKRNIEKGHLAQLKHPNQGDGENKPLSNIPRVIVAVDRGTVDDLLRLGLNVQDSEESFKLEYVKAKTEEEKKQVGSVDGQKVVNSRKKIAGHPFQIEMLEQIRSQLKKQNSSVEFNADVLKPILQNSLNKVEKVLNSPDNKAIQASDEYFYSDKKMLASLEQALEAF